MTKKLRIKANDLKKKEDIIKAKQMAVAEREEFWQDKNTEISDKEYRLKRGLEECSEKIDMIDTKEKTLESK